MTGIPSTHRWRGRPPARKPILAATLAGALAAGVLAGCGAEAAPDQVKVTATDSACQVAVTSLPSGTHTFAVTNQGTKVTEFYVLAAGDRIMGEVENIGPGLSRNLIVELPAGTYQTACKPGMIGKGIRGALTITGSPTATRAPAVELRAAATSYKRYVNAQTGPLVAKTTEFVNAVKGNDIANAKKLFPIARTYWERIEPVAESFGDLDPKVDARENDVAPGTPWTGFHRIEKALWVSNSTAGMAPIADTLLVDVKTLQKRASTTQLSALQLANGAKELLDEVATGKITGEEDRYSHTDLWDFQANVDGSRAAIAALRPVLEARDKTLVTTIDTRFTTLANLMAKHQAGDGFKLYTQLTQPEIRQLSAAVDAVAEPLSRVAAVVAKK